MDKRWSRFLFLVFFFFFSSRPSSPLAFFEDEIGRKVEVKTPPREDHFGRPQRNGNSFRPGSG